ncbi:MAG: hypothetical protein IJ806_02825 [Ruminococcus sp.]|nr:hypothetical protein [Ruminococcus sp.]
MSKKDRLKAQSLRQAKELKEEEQREKEEKARAAGKVSKGARKMMRQKESDPAAINVLKVLLLIPYLYSGFFYGNVLLLAIAFDRIEPLPPRWVFYFTLAGVAVLTAGVVLEFLKKHLISFAAVITGTVFYMKAAKFLIDRIQDRLEKVYVTIDIRDMDKRYMLRHYPILAMPVISLLIVIIWAVLKIRAKRKAQHLRDTAPVASIIDD